MNEIVSALQSAGAFVLRMERNRAGFDILANGPTGSYILRYGDSPLTAFENLVRLGIEAAGGGYYIVRTPQDAVDLVRGSARVAKEILERENEA